MELLVSGCSFSSDPQGWQKQLTSRYDSVTNLAHWAVGNTYIANTLQDQCLMRRYDMVLVMWSGYSRIDIPSQWRQRRADDYEWFVEKHRSRSDIEWLLSGGSNASWCGSKDSDVRELFQRLYLEMDLEHLAYLTLKNILSTQHMLENLGQPYRFMSFINFWDSDRPSQGFRSFYYDDPPISTWPRLQSLVNCVDWDQWIFDQGRNGIYERCRSEDDLASDRLHPGITIQKAWGDRVIQHLQENI